MLVAASLLSACAAPRGVATPRPATQAAQRPGALEAAISDRCGTCHDGDPSRPTFDGKSRFSRREAMTIGLAVASDLMPPLPSRLDAEARARLLLLACERVAEGEPVSACLARFAPAPPGLWLVHPRNLGTFVDEAAAYPAGTTPKPRAPGPHPLALVKQEVRTVRLGLTLMTLLAIYAADRCRDANADGAVYDACLARAIDYTKGALPRQSTRSP